MQDRLRWSYAAPGLRSTVHNSTPGDPIVRARMVAAVGRALAASASDERDALASLYAATRDRTRELRHDGRRAEEALMILKREVSADAERTVGPKDSASYPPRIAVLLQHVVRWCVACYYAAN